MKYFNPTFLTSIFRQYGPIKIYVNKEYLNIVDLSDIAENQGVGYKSDGKSLRFNYIDITHIKLGEDILTKDLLNPEEKPAEPEPKEEPATPDKSTDEKPKDEKPEPKKREESFKVTDKVIVISDWLGYKKGIITSINENKYYVKIFNSKTGTFGLNELTKGELRRG